MPIGPDYDERTGENEALFREVNERLEERKRDDSAWDVALAVDLRVRGGDLYGADRDVSLGDQRLRSEPTHFAVVSNEEHVSLECERIVEKRDRSGWSRRSEEAAEVAEETDPR